MATKLQEVEFDVAMALRWENLFDYKVHRANREHKCNKCHQSIQPGQYYARIVSYAPWTMLLDDVDGDGRPIGSPAGEWGISKCHVDCLTNPTDVI